MDATLNTLLQMTDDALAGDQESADYLRLLGEALLMAGGVAALVGLQGHLHDYAVQRFEEGSRGDAIGNYWEHLPAWATL